MSVLDDLAVAVANVAEFTDLRTDEIVAAVEPEIEDLTEFEDLLGAGLPEPTGNLANIVEGTDVGGRLEDVFEVLLGLPTQVIEQDTVESMRAFENIGPDRYLTLYTEIRGSATEDLILVLVVIELLNKLDEDLIDPIDEFLVQFFSAAAIDSVYGRQVEGFLSEGLDPAIKQDAHRATRTKQADFQDFVEANLRQKATNPEIDPRDDPVGQGIQDLLHPDDLGYLAEPDEYGTRPDQEPLYELDGLNVNEPEEIIEEPIQYGIPVPLRPVEQITELAGQPEDVKQIYKQVIDQLPKTENLLQDYARLTEFNFRLREKVQAGAINPETAVQVIEPELRDLIVNALPEDRYRADDRTADEVVDILSGELLRNFRLLDSIPSDPPTFSDIERAYREGVISQRAYKRLYDEFGPQSFFFEEKLTVQDIRTGADDIARQETLGRLSTTEAQSKLSRIGFSPDQIAEILAGADPDELIAQQQQGRTSASQVPLSSIPGIGENRALGLNVVGIETIADLANASVEEVANNARVGNDEATRFIRIAQGVLERAT